MWRFSCSNGITEGFHRKVKLIQRCALVSAARRLPGSGLKTSRTTAAASQRSVLDREEDADKAESP
ncbi:MAG: hypothetical protein AAF709_21435, partial [Pseudomonadota bacterium]